MLNERFDELSRKREAQFLGAGAYESSLSPTVNVFALGAGVEGGKIDLPGDRTGGAVGSPGEVLK